MTAEEAILHLRSDPQYSHVVRDSYFGADLLEAAARFATSAEFSELGQLLGDRICGCAMLDLGAGNGIASWAFARKGATTIYALEPDPSNEIGRGAIERLCASTVVRVLDAFGEQIPLAGEQVDVVYARQALHHTRDLHAVLLECARILRPGGIFVGCREHVADDDQQLEAFLANHPVHLLAHNENAYRLSDYVDAIKSAGLHLVRVLGPWDSVINAFPTVRTTAELEVYHRTVLERRFGGVGQLLSFFPGVKPLIWFLLKRRRTPGRMYSFLAFKPEDTLNVSAARQDMGRTASETEAPPSLVIQAGQRIIAPLVLG